MSHIQYNTMLYKKIVMHTMSVVGRIGGAGSRWWQM